MNLTVINAKTCPACARPMAKGTQLHPRTVEGRITNLVCEQCASKDPDAAGVGAMQGDTHDTATATS